MSYTAPTVPSAPCADDPLFSVVWYGRNRIASARETLAALQVQTIANFELVVEDCGSDDGTLELFQAAAMQDSRIRVFQAWKRRAGDALLNALRRCRGTYVSITPSSGHLLPDALEIAARELDLYPGVGALCSAGFMLDAHGAALERIDIVSLLLTSYWPFLPAGFFRRNALLEIGIADDGWFCESLALDLCCRLATDWGLRACADTLVSCPDPRKQHEGLVHNTQASIDDRLDFVAKTFSSRGFFGRDSKILELESKANQLAILWSQFRMLSHSEIEYLIQPPLLAVARDLLALLRRDHRVLRTLNRLLCTRSHNLGMLAAPLQKALSASRLMKGRLPIHVGYTIWGPHLHGSWLIRKIIQLTIPSSQFHPAAAPRDEIYADLYALAGARYEARGQIELALEMWDQARTLKDINLDSLACQAELKSSLATNASLAARQKIWAQRHAAGCSEVVWPKPPLKGRKIRIGYFCAFMDSDTIRNMMRNVIAAHDRDKFEVFGYADLAVPQDIKSAFDLQRFISRECTSLQFANHVRADNLDVFVELTGFSPGNRFAAMALRIAPVQISYLNHTGTSQVPNVDYVLSDEICTPSGDGAQQYYSERIYRLPGCFFCFDYSTAEEPPVAPSPHLKSGIITFGCFGTGGKIGTSLIETWAKLLHRVPNSMLHIQNPQLSAPEERRYMTDRFAMFGIGAERLILEDGVDRPTLLKIYSCIDISLDTWPYCGGNTIAESQWHGVPVVTRRGDRFSSAYGASLVTAAGCGELVANSDDEYVDVAARLAGDSPRLIELRQTLRQLSIQHGLGDSKLHARRLEQAYVDMLNQVPDGEMARKS